MHANKAIRDTLKQQIQASYTTGEVFTGRTLDMRQTASRESVQIFLRQGVEQGQGVAIDNRSSLQIIVRKTGIAHDDELDAIAISVDAALSADVTLGGVVSGIIYESYEYLDDEDSKDFSALLITYLVFH